MITKIKEWWREWIPMESGTFIFVLLVAVFAFGLIVGHSLDRPDQPKMSIAENLVQRVKIGHLDDGGIVEVHYSEPPFNPATMEITEIKQVGCKRKLIVSRHGYGLESAISGDTLQYADVMDYCNCDTAILVKPEHGQPYFELYNFDGWEAVTESTIVPKTPPLLTREENEKLKDLLGRQ